EHIERREHDGMMQRTAAGLPGTPRHYVHRAFMRVRTSRIFSIKAIASGATITCIQDHARSQGGGNAVVPVDKVRALVGMAVAAKHRVDAARFEDRECIFA